MILTTLLATKFFAPLPPAHAVSRPLLIKRLHDGVTRKLTLVCASAGFGKSTLISEWANDCPYPSAWLSLDEDDRDLSLFLEYLVASLQTISQTVGEGISAMLRASPPATAEIVLTSLLNQLSIIPGKLVLILDDYHLSASIPVNEALTFLIAHMPAQLHLVIASREEPEILLGRLRLEDQITEIRQEDLRFALDEAAEFFNQGLNLGLSSPQVRALEARTEGWIAGLKLAAISLHRHKNPETFIASFTGSHRFVQDYLIEEVLNQQSPAVQSFLLRTSVLDRLCGPLCDAVLQSHSGQQILNQLDYANLFIVPLDAERQWYRYHHLFSELLRQRLGQNEPVEPLHLRASQWYEVNGLEVEAFHQATSAKDIPRSIRLIEGNGMPLYFRGETAPIIQWLSLQPHAVLNTYPYLWVAFSWSLLFGGHPRQIEEKLLCAEAAMRLAPQDMSAMEINGQIAVLWAWLAVYRNEADSIYTHASRALELLNQDSRPARTAAQCALGVAQMFRGKRVEASEAFLQVIDTVRSSGNLMFSAVASTALAGIHATNFKLHLAAATYRDVIQMIADPTHSLGYEAHLGLAKIYYDWNELDQAESHALVCSELVARVKSESEVGADLLLVRLMLARDKHTESENLLARTNVTAKTGQLAGRMQEAAELHVLHLLRRGEIKEAAYFSNQFQLPIGLARTLLAQYKGFEALRVVESHRSGMEAQGLAQEALKARVVQAMVHQAVGDVDVAVQVLSEAVTQAEPQGSIRLFLDEGVPMKTLLTKLQHKTGMSTYVSQLLAAFGTQMADEKRVTVAALSHLPPEVFSQRELEILRLIQDGNSNQKISERLFLSLSTVKWHNQNIFAKLDVQRRTEAVARALELKLL
jgi:LuxR family maltose regulon positive regulatory protein